MDDEKLMERIRNGRTGAAGWGDAASEIDVREIVTRSMDPYGDLRAIEEARKPSAD